MKELNSLLTIIVPTFNQGKYIEDCLTSILTQTYQNIEVIIQDALSTDNTEEICQKIVKSDSRIKYFREKDTGQSDALNKGLNRATGYYWTWLCSDDRYNDKNALNGLIKRFSELSDEEFARTAGVYGDAFYVNENGNFIAGYGNANRELSLKDFKTDWPLAQPSLILKTEMVVKAGGVDASLYLGMDLDLFVKILKHDVCFKYVAVPVVDIRIQDNSKSVKFREATAVNALKLVNKHFGNIGTRNESAFIRELEASVGRKKALKHLIKIHKLDFFRYFITSFAKFITEAKQI
ncbi:MAG: glycosyltransferase [Bacteriovoracaceae bacterium]